MKYSTSKKMLGTPKYHLVPSIQQHNVTFTQIILGEVSYLNDHKTSSFVGAFKKPRRMIRDLLLQSARQRWIR